MKRRGEAMFDRNRSAPVIHCWALDDFRIESPRLPRSALSHLRPVSLRKSRCVVQILAEDRASR